MRFIKSTIEFIVLLTLGPLLLLGCVVLLLAYYKYIAIPTIDYIDELNVGYDYTDPLQLLRAAFSFAIGLAIYLPWSICLYYYWYINDPMRD